MSDNKIPDDIKDYPEKIGNLYIRADVATIGVGYFKYKALEKKLSESIPVSELKAFIKKWTASHFSGFDKQYVADIRKIIKKYKGKDKE